MDVRRRTWGGRGAHRARRPVRTTVALIGAFALLLIAATVPLPGRGSAEPGVAPCPDPGLDLTLAAAPEIAPTVTQMIAQAGCERVTVTAATAARVLPRVAAGRGQPDVWLPDSSLWVTGLSAGRYRPVVDSVASSPVLLVGAGGEPPASWAQARADPALVLGDPLSTAASAALLAGSGKSELVRLARRSTAAGAESRAEAGRLRLLAERDTGVTAVSEQQWRQAPERAELEASVPSRPFRLDYPAVVTAIPARQRLLAPLLDHLAGLLAESRDHFAAAGFDAPAARTTTPGLADQLRRWAALVRPPRAMLVVDLSVSMLTAAGGVSRIALAAGGASRTLPTLPADAELGLTTVAGDGTAAPVPLHRLNGRHAHRLALALESLPARTGGDGGFHAGVLAAYQSVRDGYLPSASNAVVVITDDPPRPGADRRLLAALRERADPERPVRVITIAVSPGASGHLAELAAATEGRAYLARTPVELIRAFGDALAGWPGRWDGGSRGP